MNINIAAPALSAHDGLHADPLAPLRAEAASGVPEPMFRLAAALAAEDRMEEAFGLYRAAAAAGHGGAQVEHARMLLYGVGTDADPQLAVEWLRRAEGLGNAIAGYHLALVALGDVVLPRDGRINERILAAVQQDYLPAVRAAAIHFGRKADPSDQALCIKLLERATRRGDALAAQLLAERLEHGEGCEPQPSLAMAVRAQMAHHGVVSLPRIVAQTAPANRSLRPGLVPPGTLAFEEALIPPHTTALSERPQVGQIDGLLSTDECRLLVATALPRLDAAQSAPLGTAPNRCELRPADDGRLDPSTEDFALRVVQLRMARAARAELVQAEPLVVEHFDAGQESRPHRDYLPPAPLGRRQPRVGERMRTIAVYLNDAASGGETEFPFAQLSIAPIGGCAVVFDNLLADGSPDTYSLHAELPVLRGEKWLATQWLRERPHRLF